MAIHELVKHSGVETSKLYTTWWQQTTRLTELGFQKELGYPSTEAYLDFLPQIPPQIPDNPRRLGLVTPLIIEPRTPLELLAEKCGVSMELFGDGVLSDWEGNCYETPTTPYIIWVGARKESERRNRTIPFMRNMLLPEERGATAQELLHYFMYDPRILRTQDKEQTARFFAMLGSKQMTEDLRAETFLYLGMHMGKVTITDNGNSVSESNERLEALIVAR